MNRWEEQLQKEVDLLSTYLSHAQGDRNLEIIVGRYEAIMKRIKSLKESYLIELQLLKDRNERKEYQLRLERQTKRIEEITVKFDRIIQLKQKKLLTNIPTNLNSNSHQNSKNIELGSIEEQTYSEAKTIQNNTKYSLIRTNDMIEHSTIVAASTLETLQSQREQIKGIGNTLVNLELNATHSRKLVKEYASLIASDRIFQFFTVLNTLLIVLIILYVIILQSN